MPFLKNEIKAVEEEDLLSTGGDVGMCVSIYRITGIGNTVYNYGEVKRLLSISLFDIHLMMSGNCAIPVSRSPCLIDGFSVRIDHRLNADRQHVRLKTEQDEL